MRQLHWSFGGAAAAIAGAILVGCLFPSFDDLKKDTVAPGDDDDPSERDSGPTKSSSSSSGASSSTSGSTTSSSSSGSSGTSASSSSGSTPTKTIRCGDKTCTADQVCCSPIVGDDECRPASNPSCPPDDLLVCDGAQDCGPGQSCCQNGTGGGGSVCRTGACAHNEYTYCQPDAPMCPPDIPKCTGDAIAGAHADNFKNCE